MQYKIHPTLLMIGRSTRVQTCDEIGEYWLYTMYMQ